MRLKDKQVSPVGGFWYDDPLTNKVIVTDGNLDKLIKDVKSWHSAQGLTSPPELADMIENQICDRIPSSKCYKSGLGDLVAKVVKVGATIVDAVAGTDLKKKARRCGGCSKRRARMNS